jgi:hypothetical protein
MSRTIVEMEDTARRAFAFLETEFGAVLEQPAHEPWWRRLIYRCNTGSAEIYLDEREDVVSVHLGATGGERLPLWAILEARGERPPETDIEAWAQALRSHGAELLRGDSSGYTGVEAAIAARGAELERFVANEVDKLRARRKRRG